MGRISLVAAALVMLPSLVANAQLHDTLQVGDRVRVRVAATRGTTNLFVGNLESVSQDTLVIAIPGGKGSIILPRAAIAEVALSQGNESRLRRIPGALPFVLPGLLIATLPPPTGPHHNAFQNQRYILGALSVLPIIGSITQRPREKFEPVYRWLEGK